MSLHVFVFVLATGILQLSGCSWLGRGHPWVTAGPVPVTHLAGWQHETGAGLREAFASQCSQSARLGKRWTALCAEIAGLPEPAATGDKSDSSAADPVLRHWIEARFDAWALTEPNGAADGLLTGYYEPVVRGSLERRNHGQTALHAPPDMAAGTRFATRAAIVNGEQQGALANRELVWIDDPVDAFFLHIQGSGRVLLPDGRIVRVGFAAHNGHPYVPIGRALIERRAIDRRDMSAQAIRRWLREHPGEADAVMNLNPRYVFFRRSDDGDTTRGPIGSLGVPLTPGRSVATDRRYVPPGALLFLDVGKRRDRRGNDAIAAPGGIGLALSQDTGGAIQGAVRADLYTGSGAAAGETAGTLRNALRLWLLWPRGAIPPGHVPFIRSVPGA